MVVWSCWSLKENKEVLLGFLTSLATNDEEFEKLNDNPRPPLFSLQIYQINKDKLNTQTIRKTTIKDALLKFDRK